MKEVVTYRHFMNAPAAALPHPAVRQSYKLSLFGLVPRLQKRRHSYLSGHQRFVRRYDPVIDELLEVTDLVMLISNR